MVLKNLIFIFFFLFSFLISAQKQEEKLQIIIDADTANEIDDLFAIIRALGEPRFELLGITSAQFHTSPYATTNTALESQEMNEALINLIPKYQVPIIIGSPFPLENNKTPQTSEASQFIINQAKILPKGKKLHLVILGSCTNVASALLEAPEIKSKLMISYIGFWHDPVKNTYNKNEFNTNNDTIATNFLLDYEGLNFEVMSATTSQYLVFDKMITFEKLGNNILGKYIKERWESYERWWTKNDLEKKRWIMWDLAIIQALVHPEWTKIKSFKTPLENRPREIQIYTDIDTLKIQDNFWNHYKTLIN